MNHPDIEPMQLLLKQTSDAAEMVEKVLLDNARKYTVQHLEGALDKIDAIGHIQAVHLQATQSMDAVSESAFECSKLFEKAFGEYKNLDLRREFAHQASAVVLDIYEALEKGLHARKRMMQFLNKVSEP